MIERQGGDVKQGAELLSVKQMYAADAAAMDAGTPGLELMESAGRAIADAIRARWAPRPIAILCGPGNNGGDGFVVARLLREAGWTVTLGLLGDISDLKGDAAENAARWDGETRPLGPDLLDGQELVVDAVFGAGLARAPEGVVAEAIASLAERDIPCIGVDVPSGVHGDTGAVLGTAPRCVMTVTFFRKKPAHVLMPGRLHCGEVIVADIGIPETVIGKLGTTASENGPAQWLSSLRWPDFADHKYTRGHLLLSGGAEMTGAIRLATRAARRVGLGMATIAAPPEVLPIYAADAPGVLTVPATTADEFAHYLSDGRKNAVLIGPGGGIDRTTRDKALIALDADRPTLLDADALTTFQDDPDALFEAIGDAPCVLTPHQGEFSRLFRVMGDKLTRARLAAETSGAVVLLKGADTVIAAPDGRALVNTNAPPDLATAGSGDVLAGLIAGLLAQGVPPFEAAGAGAWIHGAAAADFGPGLIAEDIPDRVPLVLNELKRAP